MVDSGAVHVPRGVHGYGRVRLRPAPPEEVLPVLGRGLGHRITLL